MASPPRSRPSARVAFLLGIALTAGSGVAQQRTAAGGRVLGPDGSAVARATVTFVGCEAQVGDLFAPADLVEVTTDARGRFRAELVPGCSYTCWSTGPAVLDGSRLVSGVRTEVTAGSGFELALQNRRSPASIVVRGEDRWSDLGPLRYSVAVSTDPLAVRPLEFTDGEAPLQVLPADTDWVVFVDDAKGQPLFRERVSAQPGRRTFVVPPPREVTVHVVDAQGVPAAGATVAVQIGSGVAFGSSHWISGTRALTAWRPAATTAADGTAVVRIAARSDPRTYDATLLFLAAAAGHAGAIGGYWDGQVVCGGEAKPRGKEPVVTLRLGRAANWTGMLADEASQPIALAGVALTADLPVRFGDTMRRLPLTFRTRTDGEGAFAFDSLPPDLVGTALRYESPQCRLGAANAASFRPRRAPAGRLPVLLPPDPQRPYQLRERTLPQLTLVVTRPDGGPARDAELFLVPGLDAEAFTLLPEHRMQPDATGTASFRIEPGTWFVGAIDDEGFACAALDVTGDTTTTLPMQEHARMRGTLRADGGIDPRETVFAVAQCTWKNAGSALDGARFQVASRWNPQHIRQTHAAADGTFELRFVAVPGATFVGRADLVTRSARFALTPGANGPIELKAP